MAKTITRAICNIDVRQSLPFGDGPGMIISWDDSAGDHHQLEIFDVSAAEEIGADLTACKVMGDHFAITYLVGFIRHELLRRATDAHQADAAELIHIPRLFTEQDTR
jgi:hypothetical protein